MSTRPGYICFLSWSGQHVLPTCFIILYKFALHGQHGGISSRSFVNKKTKFNKWHGFYLELEGVTGWVPLRFSTKMKTKTEGKYIPSFIYCRWHVIYCFKYFFHSLKIILHYHLVSSLVKYLRCSECYPYVTMVVFFIFYYYRFLYLYRHFMYNNEWYRHISLWPLSRVYLFRIIRPSFME